MLVKQGWKLQTNSMSLVSLIFKAQYFPSGNYLTTRVYHNPSYVWRNISFVHGLLFGVVRGGALVQVTLFQIPILNEPWLQGGNCNDGNLPENYFLRDYTVHSLMDTGNKQWNTNLIHHIFSADKANDILQTPLVPHIPVNCLILKGEKNGHYSVKSAYKLCMEELVDTSHLRRLGYWAGIWKLNAPPKI